MSNRLYDILNTFNNLVAKDEPKKQLTESAVAKPKSKLEETMAKVEADLKTFKEAKKAKPDFLDVDKDGDTKEPFKKAVKDKQVKEAAKPDFLDMDKDGDKKEPMKKAIKNKTVNEAPGKLVSGEPLGIKTKMTPFYFSKIAKYLKDNGLQSVAEFSAKDVRALAAKFGSSTEAIVDLIDQPRGFAESAENPYQQRILDSDPETLAKFLETGYIDTTSDLYYNMYEYYANQMPDKIRRNMDKQYDFITAKIREVAGGVNESAAPGQEAWIKKNKERFVKQYGKKKGMEVLYATAWKRSKNEDAHDAEISEEDPVYETAYEKDMDENKPVVVRGVKGAKTTPFSKKFKNMAQYEKWADSEAASDYEVRQVMQESISESDDYWDFKDLKDTPTSGTRKVAGTRYGGSAQKDDDDEEESNTKPAGEKRGRGRPKGPGKKMGAKGPTGKSKLMKETSGDSLGEIAEDLQHVVDRLSDIGEVELAKHLQPIVWDLDDRDPLDEGDYGWDYPEEKSKAPTSRKVSGTRYGGSLQKDDDEDDEVSPSKKADAPKRGRGRPKGSGKKLGSRGPSGKSKSMKESRPSLMDRLLDETYANFGEDAGDLTLDQDQLRQHIGDENFEALRQSMGSQGTFPESMYDALYDYFSETGEMPYGAATAEDEDPYNWIHQKLDQIFGDDTGNEDYGTFGDDERPEEDEMNAESVNESKQMVAESLSRILHSYPYEVKTFLAGGDMDNDLYQALYDYYNDQGELPRQVKAGNATVEWIADKFGTDLRNVELEEDGPKMSDVPAYLRKVQGQNFPLTRDQVTPAEQHLWVVPGPGSRDFEARAFPNTPQGKMAADEFAYGVKGNVVLSAEQPVAEESDSLGAELNELARLAGLKESISECGEMSPFTQTGQPEQQSGMSINTNIDTRTGTKTMTVTADGDVADKLAEILSLSGLATQVTSRSSEVVGQEVPQEPEMQVVAVGEAKDEDAREKFHASTTPDPEVAGVDAIIDQGDDLNRKKKQHADKPKLGDNPMATENFSLSKSLIRELESIKVKK